MKGVIIYEDQLRSIKIIEEANEPVKGSVDQLRGIWTSEGTCERVKGFISE